MVDPRIIFILAHLILLGIAIVVSLNATSLSLPIPPGLTVPTLLLPAFAAANTYVYHRLLVRQPSTRASATRSGILRARLLTRFGLQLLQLILSTALATMLLEYAAPGERRTCALDNQWQRFWRTHDATAIRGVQEALRCCGYRSTRDRAWPFPSDGRSGGERQCLERFGWTTSCVGPWTQAMGRNAGVEVGAVFGVALLQLLNLLLTHGFVSWPFRRRTAQPSSSEESTTRPLLTGSGSADYTGTGTSQDHEDGNQDTQDNGNRNGVNRNGERARIEPSALSGSGHGENVWRTEDAE